MYRIICKITLQNVKTLNEIENETIQDDDDNDDDDDDVIDDDNNRLTYRQHLE